ncbi:MAG: alcohol dehydrogenase [Candidatus Ozemobacter sibiricus]|jgi:alcohol dehydrogenase class IV|uniref:Alcohol dehydrogenase n=1 Tax=Candidatus Ozemobacter sibiricus TaxID=2268124 RepID=A0A367ZTK5_9BACT|nr:MAG: alcohol dehydrogenase [Candidatus Ozemobacter sibiricus]
MQFTFATAQRIIFGEGVRHQLGGLADEWPGPVMVLCGSDRRRAEFALAELKSRQRPITLFQVAGEPTIGQIQAATQRARHGNVALVIAIGGGSVIDAGKAVATLLCNDGPIEDYLEVIGRGRPLTRAGLPVIAVPTTAGTGSEVTRNAVLAAPPQKVKVSLRHHLMLPRLALVDPELTYSLPPELTASTGLDALTQLIEPFLSLKANPLADAVCREGLPRAARALARAFRQGDDREARRDLALASLLGGMALANAGLGAVHGLAAPLGGLFPAPHGALCARLLPEVLTVNLRAVRERGSDPTLQQRFDELGRLLTGRPEARADDAIGWVRDLVDLVQPRALSSYGLTPADFPQIVEKARASSSMQANPVALTNDELLEILALALG